MLSAPNLFFCGNESVYRKPHNDIGISRGGHHEQYRILPGIARQQIQKNLLQEILLQLKTQVKRLKLEE